MDFVAPSSSVSRINQFKFEEMWLSDENCKSIVENCWNRGVGNTTPLLDESSSFKPNLHHCGVLLAKWGRWKKREMFKQVNEQRKLLQIAYSSKPFPSFHEIVGIEDRLNRALED